jgi:hypothetical protein
MSTENHEVLKDIIRRINILPDLVVEEHGILLPWDKTDELSKIINMFRKQQRAITDWLKYYLLPGHHYLIFELSNTDKAFYKPHAQQAVARYNLAQEVYALSGNFQYHKFTPDWFLMALEWEICESRLRDSGITGTPRLWSKHQYYEQTLSRNKDLEDVEANVRNGESYATESPYAGLLGEAQRIAAIPENRDFKYEFWQYLKKIAQYERQIERSKLTTVYYCDGKIVKKCKVLKGGSSRKNKQRAKNGSR